MDFWLISLQVCSIIVSHARYLTVEAVDYRCVQQVHGSDMVLTFSGSDVGMIVTANLLDRQKWIATLDGMQTSHIVKGGVR
jgi:hypothetical protein